MWNLAYDKVECNCSDFQAHHTQNEAPKLQTWVELQSHASNPGGTLFFNVLLLAPKTSWPQADYFNKQII